MDKLIEVTGRELGWDWVQGWAGDGSKAAVASHLVSTKPGKEEVEDITNFLFLFILQAILTLL